MRRARRLGSGSAARAVLPFDELVAEHVPYQRLPVEARGERGVDDFALTQDGHAIGDFEDL